MNSAEVVVREVQGHGMTVVFDLLGKAICQASETAHSHTHCEVLPFYKTGRDVLRVRLSAEYASAAPNAGCGAVAALWGVARGAEYLMSMA